MIRIFKLTTKQRQELKKWNDRQTDVSFIEWYTNQIDNSEKMNEIIREGKVRDEKDLTLEELYRISDLLTEYLGGTALSIKGKESIFEKNPLDIFNIRLRDLLFGKNALAERVDRFIKLKGVGPMTVSQFLCLYDHEKYAFYAGFMEALFKKILLLDQNQFNIAKNQAEEEFSISSLLLSRKDFFVHVFFSLSLT